MDYRDILEFTGATVHNYESFGSYQGDWLAKVTYRGETGWVKGYYGSCSVCDALQSEFGYSNHNCNGEDYYDPMWGNDGFRDGCQECQNIRQRLVKFGEGYLDTILTQDEVESAVSENLAWDMESEAMLRYVKENAI